MAHHNEASKFVNALGDSGKKLADALVELLKKLEEHRKAMEKATLKEQQKLQEKIGKTLQDAGFEASPENVKLFEQHTKAIKEAEARKADLENKIHNGNQAQLDLELRGERVQLKLEQKELAAIDHDLLTPDQQARIDKISAELKDLDEKIDKLDYDQDAEDYTPEELADLQAELDDVNLELDGLMNGEDLKGLKVDTAKQSLDVFKAGSTGKALAAAGGRKDYSGKGAKLAPDPNQHQQDLDSHGFGL